MARIIREVQCRYVFVENSPMLTSRGLGRVLGDLAEMGFDAEWGVLGARDAGAPHKRDRIWILARHPDRDREPVEPVNDEASGVPSMEGSDSSGYRLEGQQQGGAEKGPANRPGHGSHPGWWEVEPGMGRVAHGVARRVDRLRTLGNGQVPAVAALAWRTLRGRMR
jgi:DNA (cytosine-5)-methyltransferase 1